MSVDYLVGALFFKRTACSVFLTIAKGVALGGVIFLGGALVWAALAWIFG